MYLLVSFIISSMIECIQQCTSSAVTSSSYISESGLFYFVREMKQQFQFYGYSFSDVRSLEIGTKTLVVPILPQSGMDSIGSSIQVSGYVSAVCLSKQDKWQLFSQDINITRVLQQQQKGKQEQQFIDLLINSQQQSYFKNIMKFVDFTMQRRIQLLVFGEQLMKFQGCTYRNGSSSFIMSQTTNMEFQKVENDTKSQMFQFKKKCDILSLKQLIKQYCDKPHEFTERFIKSNRLISFY